MSKQQAKAFIEKLRGNKELLTKLKSVLNTEHEAETTSSDHVELIVNFASGLGYSFSSEEYKSVASTMQSVDEQEELSDEDLENVAGGNKMPPGMSSVLC
jgi:predicted ribosomally synthesized peptide with nif11-like leader